MLAKLTQIGFSGFQSFEERADIPIAPLTLLYGPNSSGKSAVYDALLLAERFWKFASSGEPPEGWLFSAGPSRERTLSSHWRKTGSDSYAEHPLTLDVTASCEASILLPVEAMRYLPGIQRIDSGGAAEIAAQVAFEPPFAGTAHISIKVGLVQLYRHDEKKHIAINLHHPMFGKGGAVLPQCAAIAAQRNAPVIFRDGWLELPAHAPVMGRRQLELVAIAKQLLGNRGPKNPNEWYGALMEFIEFHDALMKPVCRVIGEACRVHLVSASRMVPTDSELIYLLDEALQLADPALRNLKLDSAPEFAEVARSAASAALRRGLPTSATPARRRKAATHDTTLIDAVNRSLSEHLFVDLGYQIDGALTHLTLAPPIRGRKQNGRPNRSQSLASWMLVQLRLCDASGRRLSFTDVGSGLGYVLPVFAALWSFDFTFVQQPELHLHPALQASIADAFIEAQKTRKTLIIETHSEHILLRLLRRIRQTNAGVGRAGAYTLTPADVRVLYFDPSAEVGTRVYPLRVTNDGDFMDRWPRGFFDERDHELFDE